MIKDVEAICVQRKKTAQRRYMQSDLGKIAVRRYQQSDLGKAAAARYLNGEKGQQYRRNKNHRYIQNNPEKIRARKLVYKAIKRGKLKRQPCIECSTTIRVHAHHADYEKPLEVEWLCRIHHTKRHHKPYKVL